jgi:hypothetical protein
MHIVSKRIKLPLPAWKLREQPDMCGLIAYLTEQPACSRGLPALWCVSLHLRPSAR